MSKKYSVQACTNCEHFKKDNKTRECSCLEGYTDTMEDWLQTSGKKRLDDFTPDDDLECFSPNKRVREMTRNQESLSSFMDDLNNMLNR